jgi:hypothetical protein
MYSYENIVIITGCIAHYKKYDVQAERLGDQVLCVKAFADAAGSCAFLNVLLIAL